MSTRRELERGELVTGEVSAKRLSEIIDVAHGTIKRWAHEGMPGRTHERRVWYRVEEVRAWLATRFPGKTTIAFGRRSFVYLAEADDGLIKIGFSSDVMRRIAELRKEHRAAVHLLACFPGGKPDELALHTRFHDLRARGEWYRRGPEIDAFLSTIRGAA